MYIISYESNNYFTTSLYNGKYFDEVKSSRDIILVPGTPDDDAVGTFAIYR